MYILLHKITSLSFYWRRVESDDSRGP